MTIELSSSNPETVKLLREIANAEPDNVLSIPISPMEGKEILSLVIENYSALSTGTVALIVALKSKIEYLKISKDGLELRSAAKEEALIGKK